MISLVELADEPFCYVTTTGRRSGQPREIEIWFGITNDTIYLLSGGGDRSDWVRNMRAEPRVRVRIKDQAFDARARVMEDGPEEDARARELLASKYQGWKPGQAMSGWARTALVVAIHPASPA